MIRKVSWIFVGLLVVLIAFAGYEMLHGGWHGSRETIPPLLMPTDTSDGGSPLTAAGVRPRPQTMDGRGAGSAPPLAPAATADIARPAPEGALSLTMIAVLLMSVVAAALIGGLVVGLRTKDPSGELGDLRKRVAALESWARQMAAPRDDRELYARYREPTPQSASRPPPPPLPPPLPPLSPVAAALREHIPSPAPSPVSSAQISEIVADYRRLLSGTISRSSFQTFFDAMGRSGPVKLTPQWDSIEPASGESFLIAVSRGSNVLVFPSYEFVSNAATQFATIASVPESVSAVFDLQRDDGEFTLERPAVFEDREDRPLLKTKGIIRGFDG